MDRRMALQMLGAGMGCTLMGAPTLSFAQASGTSRLRVALDEIPNQLDPLLYQTNPGYRTMTNIYDTLLTIDYGKGGALKPALAESWQRKDGRTVDLVLRQGVLFHDGSLLTADDVVFSFSRERMFDPKSPGYGTAQQFLSTIKTVEALDDKTIRVTSHQNDPVLELRLTAWGSQIISKKAFNAAGGFSGFGQKPIGTGPFAVVSLSPDEVKLRAHDKYWAGKPAVDSLSFRSSPELSSRIAGLASNDFDLIADVPADQFDPVKRDPRLEIVGGEIASIRVVKFDTRNAVLKDARVRRAICLAVDRKAIVDALWAGLVSVPNGEQFPFFGSLNNPARKSNIYNPDMAKQLLKQAGYNGAPIPFRINAGLYGPQLATAQILVSMWEAVGLKIDLQIKATFGQLMEYPGTGMRDGVDPCLVNDPLFGLWRSYNDSEKEIWSNESFYKLGHTLETSLDPEERKKAFSGMMDIFDEDPPALILHMMGVFYGKRKSVDWKPIPSVYMDFRQAKTA